MYRTKNNFGRRSPISALCNRCASTLRKTCFLQAFCFVGSMHGPMAPGDAMGVGGIVEGLCCGRWLSFVSGALYADSGKVGLGRVGRKLNFTPFGFKLLGFLCMPGHAQHICCTEVNLFFRSPTAKNAPMLLLQLMHETPSMHSRCIMRRLSLACVQPSHSFFFFWFWLRSKLRPRGIHFFISSSRQLEASSMMLRASSSCWETCLLVTAV